MDELQRTSSASALEAGSVARLMADASARMARFYQSSMVGKSVPAALDAAYEPANADRVRRLLEASPDQVDWWAMNQVAAVDPDAFYAVWERLKAEARHELASGHRAASTVDVAGRPWDRAQFLALRDSFRDDWQPRGGVEDALVDAAALSFARYLEWMNSYMIRTELQEEKVETEYGGYRRRPVQVGDVAAREEATDMAERFSRMFLRTLRALSDHRRRPMVTVQNARQVNVAQQQVNVADG